MAIEHLPQNSGIFDICGHTAGSSMNAHYATAILNERQQRVDLFSSQELIRIMAKRNNVEIRKREDISRIFSGLDREGKRAKG
jgi:hypothetical protein